MSNISRPTIGIVSGIGPLAGCDILAKLLRSAAERYGAVEDNEYPDVVLVSHGISGVDNTGALSDRFEKEITAMVQKVEDAGVSVIGIACNTAHVYLAVMQSQSKATLVNLIDEVSKKAAEMPKKYLLLTSLVSKQQRLYHGCLAKHTVSFQETNDNQQALLDKAIGLVMAHKLTAAGVVLDDVLASAKDAGFDAVIAGCTELPIAIDHSANPHEITVIDSNQVLADSLLTYYYHKLGDNNA